LKQWAAARAHGVASGPAGLRRPQRCVLDHSNLDRVTQIADQARLHGVPEDEVVATVLLAESAVKRLVEPEEVAVLAVWLAGPGAGMTSGSWCTIDGAWTAE